MCQFSAPHLPPTPFLNLIEITLIDVMGDNEEHKHRLKGMSERIINEVDPRHVLDYLIEKRVFSIEAKDIIMSSSTRQDRCRALVNKLLVTSHPKAIVYLKEALQEHHSWIAKEFAEYQNEVIEENEKLKYGLNRMRKSLVEQVDPRHVLDYLIEKGVISIEAKDIIMSSSTRQDRCRALVDKLSVTSHPRAIVYLKEALEERYSWIAEELAEYQNVDGQLDDLLTENRSHKSDGISKTFSECKIIGTKELKKLKKLPKYCQLSYDLWIGHLESSNDDVCIKELISSQQKDEFFSDVRLLKKLSHPRIANLLGRSPRDCPEVFVVFESTPLTNVYNFFESSRSMRISNDVILQWVIQLACGLKYLHDNRILHRSIFTSNILLCSSAHSIKISNFQNATILDSKDYLLEVGCLAGAEETAPEIISKNKWSFATDVWSFGLTALKMFINGKKIFPERTQKDIKDFLTSAGDEDMESFLDKHLPLQQKAKETIRKCLKLKRADRPKFSSLCSFSNFKEVNTDVLTWSKSKETIVHENPARGITSLGGVLYVIYRSSSDINRYDIANGLIELESIKPFKFSSNNVISLTSCAHVQCLYVLNVEQSVVFRVSTDRPKVVLSWNVLKRARCISVTHHGSILVCCSSPESCVVEYNSEGMVLSKISYGEIPCEPLKLIEMDEMHYLVLHDFCPKNRLYVMDRDGVKSSGYGCAALYNVSDVTIHKTSKKILLALCKENRIVSFDQHLNDEPVELLNIDDGIIWPIRIHATENLVFVCLASGNIYCFQFFSSYACLFI